MINTLKQIINMKASLGVNSFIFYFKKLWVIGSLVPDSLYYDYTTKKVLAAVVLIFRQLIDFFAKPLYLILFTVLPFFVMKGNQPQLEGQGFAVMMHLLFFQSCYIGAFGDSYIFTVSRDKVTFIKYMRMNARDYIKGSLAFHYVPFFLYYIPCFIAAAFFFQEPIWKGLAAWLMFFTFRALGEAFQLFLFDRTGKVINRSMIYNWSIIGTGLFFAYVLPYKGFIMPVSLLFHPAAILFYLVFAALCTYYITVGYRGYEKKLAQSIDLNFLLSNMLKNSSSSSFKEVEIKEKDLESLKAVGNNYKNLHGYTYLNTMFFARHRRQLLRPVYYRLAVILMLFAAALFFGRTVPTLAVPISQNMSASLLPSFVFIMYCSTVADKACKAMFYNCDKDMLHYAYYRTPQTILKTFQDRLFRVSLLNITVALGLCAAAIGFCLSCDTNIFTLDLLLFCITLILLSVLFTAHHLCLYYIFQPYSESLKIKNPFFSVINTVMYMLCFLCLQIKAGGPVFSIVVLVFTVVYILTVLILVYCRAPKSFRVK